MSISYRLFFSNYKSVAKMSYEYTYWLSFLGREGAKNDFFELIHHSHWMRAYIVGVWPHYADSLIFPILKVLDEHADCQLRNKACCFRCKSD